LIYTHATKGIPKGIPKEYPNTQGIPKEYPDYQGIPLKITNLKECSGIPIETPVKQDELPRLTNNSLDVNNCSSTNQVAYL
jgi:hypothetical protein